MNTPVSFEIAKLLFDKGFDEFCSNAIGLEYKDIVSIPFEYGVRETEYVKYGVLCNSKMDEFNSDYISCPTVTEAVMWLYEKYGIWLTSTHVRNRFRYEIIKKDGMSDYSSFDFNSPAEAYEASIEYTLKNLI